MTLCTQVCSTLVVDCSEIGELCSKFRASQGSLVERISLSLFIHIFVLNTPLLIPFLI